MARTLGGKGRRRLGSHHDHQGLVRTWQGGRDHRGRDPRPAVGGFASGGRKGPGAWAVTSETQDTAQLEFHVQAALSLGLQELEGAEGSG